MAMPGPPTTPLSASMVDLPLVASSLSAAAFLLMPNLGIRTATQDGDAIMESTAMVPQALSAHVSTSMDVNVDPTVTLVEGKVEAKATAELYL